MASKKNEVMIVKERPKFNVTVGGVKVPDESFVLPEYESGKGLLAFNSLNGLYVYELPNGGKIYTDPKSVIAVESLEDVAELVVKNSTVSISHACLGRCKITNAKVKVATLRDSTISNKKTMLNGEIGYTEGGDIILHRIADSTINDSSVISLTDSWSSIDKSVLRKSTLRCETLTVDTSHVLSSSLGAKKIMIDRFTVEDSSMHAQSIKLKSIQLSSIKNININLSNDYEEEGSFSFTDHLVADTPIENISVVGNSSFDLFNHRLGRAEFTFFRTEGGKLCVIPPSGKIMTFSLEDTVSAAEARLTDGLSFEWVEKRREANSFQDQIIDELRMIIGSRLNVMQMIDSMTDYI